MPSVSSAAVVTHGRDSVADALARLRAVADRAGVELHVDEEDGATPDIAIVLGGDGTMLRALQRFLGTRVPVMGVNFGRVGFLAAMRPEELEDGLAPELIGELERLSLPFEDGTPSEAELRVAQAQLVGWLEGLFHGIQTTLFAQQMAARAQLEQMRRALPPGIMPAPDQDQPSRGSGPYL